MLTKNPQLEKKLPKIFCKYLDTEAFRTRAHHSHGWSTSSLRFMPWQSVYSELYFTDILMPNFTAKDLDVALEDFAADRRFGK